MNYNEVRRWIRQKSDRKRGQGVRQRPDHVGPSQSKKFGCYFRHDGKPLEGCTEASDLT